MVHKVDIYIHKAKQYYLEYPFVEENLQNLRTFLLEQHPELNTIPSVDQNQATPHPAIARKRERRVNHSEHSYSWDAIEESEKLVQIERLYSLLTQEPAIIIGEKMDFINAFTQKKLEHGIAWQLKGKSQRTNISSICYFITQLQSGYIEDFPSTDFGKKLHYVFRHYDGAPIENYRHAVSEFRSTGTSAESQRIDDIIDKILMSE